VRRKQRVWGEQSAEETNSNLRGMKESGTSEHGNNSSSFIKCREVLEQLGHCCLLRKDSALLSQLLFVVVKKLCCKPESRGFETR
jgi:hypothetical protein